MFRVLENFVIWQRVLVLAAHAEDSFVIFNPNTGKILS